MRQCVGVVFLLVIGAANAISCNYIKMAGFTYKGKEGTYDRLPGEVCYGHAVYRLPSSDYLYYYKWPNSRGWVIGVSQCDRWAFARVVDAADSPQEVTAVWEEHNPYTNTWELSPRVSATCRYGPRQGVSGCDCTRPGLLYITMMTLMCIALSI